MKTKSSKLEKDSEKVLDLVHVDVNDALTLPFPEWSDQEIRGENWKGPAVAYQKPDTSPSRSRDREVTRSDASMKEEYHFVDDQKVYLPYSIVAYEWKAAAQVFPNATLEVYVDTDEYPDLIIGNKHLLHSEFMRSFISSVYMLTYLGNTTKFSTEYVSPNFTPTTIGKPWRPWHHIYSNSFVGAKYPHDPTFNKTGKYIVRLFWMGAWRKIYVDDKLPIDMLNNVMLPTTAKPEPPKQEPEQPRSASSRIRISTQKHVETKQEEKVVELWPFLLSKALLKVASLSWCEGKEIVHFDIVQCLTGWQPLRINTKGLAISNIWQMCWGYTNHYVWPPEEASISSKFEKDEEKSEISAKAKGKKEKKAAKSVQVASEDIRSCHVMARCNDLRNYTDADEPSNIFPCWDHEFLIDQTRNIPLLRSSLTVDLEHWKRVRWLAWAADNGMIPSEELLTDIKTYRLVSPFKQVSEHVIYRQPSKVDIADIMPPPIASLIPEKKGKEKEIKKGEKSPKGSQKSGGSKSSKGKEKKTEDVNSNTVDPSFWVDYKKLSSKINTLIVYYKPSAFQTKIEISDINQKQQVEKKGELEWQVLVNPFTFKISRNEPIYIFTESIDSKLIVLSLSQVGYSEILYPEKGTETPPSGLDIFTECDFCMASFVKRVRRNMTNGEENKEYVPVTKMEPVLVAHTRPVSNFVLEDYDWKTDALGNTVMSLNTYGSKTATLNLGPGRKILKLWIKSNTPYTLQIFSDTPISIGSLETVISSMSQESQLLEDMCIQIANSFAKVVEAFGTSHFSEELKNFYSSYKPQTHLTKSECVVLHNTFYDLLWELVEDSVGTKDLQALKVLFLKWQLPLRTHYPEERNLCNCYNEDDFEYLKATERYVTKIQAFFRGIYDRSYLKRHSTSHREYKNISESLFNIYSAIFSLQRRFETCPNLVRAFLAHPDLNKVKEKYQILQDLDNVLTVIKVDSTVKLAEKQWCLICRQQFFVNSQSPIPIKINLFCDLDDYVVRVINNDTTEEIKRYTNNVGVSQYKSNKHGYTALCYVWPTTTQILNYKLIFATKKEVEYDKISLSPVNVEINSFSGIYIPNVKNIICSHVVNVRCQSGLLTVHFSTSYNNAIISLRLYDDRNKLVQEVVGNGEAIIPAVHITNKNKPFYDVPMLKTGGTEKGRRATMRATIKLQEKSRQSIEEKKSSIKLDNQAMTASSLQPPSPHTRPSGFQSEKPHVLPYYHVPETNDVKRNFRVDRMIVYRIEASVLDDSWPLNFEEWKNVTSSRYQESSRLRANSDISMLSKTSLISLRKTRKQRSTIRVASASKLLSPYWIMDTIQHQDENLEIIKDFRRLSEVMAIKGSWCANDVERPKRAHEIRKEFLKAHEFPNPYTPEDATGIRSLENSAFAPEILPPLDLRKYMIKDPDEVKTKRFKNSIALEMDTKREEALIEEAEARQLQNMKQMDKFLEQQMETYHTVTNWFNEVRHESSQMIAYAMKLRTEYINETLEAQRIEKERKEKEKKVKKGKKDKKARLFQRTSTTSQTAEVPNEPQARLPFKEWSDKDIREEKWDDPKLISLREELYERFGQSHDYYHDQEPDRFYDQMHDYQQDDGYDYHRKNSSTRGSKTYQEEKRRFQDQQVVQLPQSVKLYEWKEVSEVFPNAKLVVYLKNDKYPDLITDNKHLLHSEFMRNFISSIHTLIYLGNTTRFTTQFTGPNFSATTGDSPWRPWFHIYSNQSAGTRREHDPTINKIGKYVVRLFWLGTWRKIYVDDRLPVDIFQNILLPSVAKLQEETGEGCREVFNLEVVQLWPYLLAKALLKIASLTWFQYKEIVDFDIIHCLTGWIPQKINTVGLPISEVWKICWTYTRHYSCINEVPSEKGEELKTSKSGTQMVSGKEERENNDATSKESVEEKTEGSKAGLENDSCDLIKVVDKVESAHYVVARCNDLRTFDSDQKIQNFSPCWSHEFLVDQTRDGPLIKPRLTKDLENWKRLRWLSWAKKKGLLSEDDIRTENFHYKLVSAFRKVTEPVVCEQPSRLSSDQLSLDSIDEFILAKKEKKGKKLKKSISHHRSISQHRSVSQLRSISQHRSVSQLRSISQHKNLTDRKQSKIKKYHDPKIATDEKIDKTAKQTESDPSFWVDYKDLSSQINTLTVYFKPCRMNTKIRISNLSNEGKWNVGMLSTWTLLQNPLTPKISRNEPIYIFSESLDPQFLVINLSQTGYTKILEPEEDEDITVSPVESKMDNTMECDFCLASLVKRIKVNVTKEEIKHYVSLDRFEPQLVTHDRSCSHIVLEKYNWKTDKLGDTVMSLNTYGEKTATLQFGSGRTILKLWIKSDNPYVVFLFSDDPIVVGNLETILMCMAKESLLFKSKIHEISNSFSKLVSAFATPQLSLRLKDFYRSYKPEECLTKAECLILHDTFFELMMELIKFTMGAEEMYALRILLFRWQRNPHVEYPDCYNLCNCYDDDDLEYLKLLEKYIVLIQAFLRGTIDRYFMKHHNPTFAYHNILLESLHNIYTDIFSIENRFNACSDLVRALLAHPNLNKIKEKYQIYNDLENVLTVKKFTHNVSLVEGSWAPICRQQFFVNSDEPIPVKINLFCDHAEYAVRVIDNDTNNEIKRHTNNVTVSEYKKNEKGYTVFCYAWSTTSKQLSCKLCFATKKEVQQDKLTITRVGTEVNSFYGMYIPNIDNRICKYSVGVWSESALLSAHLACSYPDVIIKLKVFDNNGKLMQEVMGKGDIVLPAIILEYRQKLDGHRSPSLTSVVSLKKRKRRQSMFPGSRLTFGSHQRYSYVSKGSDVNISESGSHSALDRDSNAKLPRKSLYSRKSIFSKKSSDSQVRGSRTSIRSNESSTMFNQQGSRQDTPDLEYLQSLYDQQKEVRNISKPRRSRLSMGLTDATPNLKFRSFTSRYTFGSQHALKAVPHVLPYDQTPQKAEEKKKLRITHPTQYTIEVSVVNDSWPLNSDEWENLEHPVPDGHASTFLSSMKEIPRPSSRTSLRSKTSVRSTRKSVFYGRKSLFLTPKASKMGEMFTGMPRRNQPQMGKPYWIMQTIVNHGQNLDINKHNDREMQMKSFKTKWSERDPTRAKRGQQIRAEFLRQNKILNAAKLFGEEIYTKRSLVKDDVLSYILPPLNLSRYMTKTVDADDRKFKNSAALEKEARIEAALFEKSEDEWRDKSQRLDDFTNQQMINLNIVNTWYNGVRKKSYRMMESAMHMKITLYEALTGRDFIAGAVEIEKRSKRRSFK